MDVGFHLFGNLTPLSLAARALKWVLVAVVCVSQLLGKEASGNGNTLL